MGTLRGLLNAGKGTTWTSAFDCTNFNSPVFEKTLKCYAYPLKSFGEDRSYYDDKIYDLKDAEIVQKTL